MDIFLHTHLGLFLFDLWLLSTKPHHFSSFSVLLRAQKQQEHHSEGGKESEIFLLLPPWPSAEGLSGKAIIVAGFGSGSCRLQLLWAVHMGTTAQKWGDSQWHVG